MKRVLWIAVLIALLTPAVHASVSVGTAQGGHLEDGFELPENNVWIRFYRKVKDRGSNHATLELAALMARASRVVNQAVGGSLLTIGDCSSESGGDIRGHRSHNSGRDVDILFYVVDDRGRSVDARGFYKFDEQGRARKKGKPQFFDVERNWWLVRTLVASEDPYVQYIFVSNPLREMMLDFAKKHGESKEILRKARRVLMQPKDALPHDDHFHVRIYCSDEDRLHGCQDSGVRWSWVSKGLK